MKYSTQINPRIKAAIGAQEIQGCFAVVRFARSVDLGLSQYDETCTLVVPFELNFIALEEVLL